MLVTGQGNDAFDARVNGGLQSGDEASVDGVSMQQGFMSQGGMVSILKDFPMSPDMVSEVKVLTSGYAPEYGSSTGGQIMAVTKSGGASFHGSVFEYNQNASRNAVAWGQTPAPFKKDNFGANIGGPVKVPGLYGDKVKSYFYFDYEGYRQVGGSGRDTLSIPSLQERQGDFTDWRDAAGNLIPIYDPATLRSDGHGGFIKDQFMGCDGQNTPNVICRRPDQRNRQAVARGPAEPDLRRPAQQLPGAARTGRDPGRYRPLHVARRHAVREQPRVRQLLAPDSACEGVFAVADGNCNRDLSGSPELVGQPDELRQASSHRASSTTRRWGT